MKRLILGLISVVLVTCLLAGCGGGGSEPAKKSVVIPDSLLTVLEDAYYIQQASGDYFGQVNPTMVSFGKIGVAKKTYGPWYLTDDWYEGTSQESIGEGTIVDEIKIKEDTATGQILIEISREVGSLTYELAYDLTQNADKTWNGVFNGTKTEGGTTTAFQIDLTNWDPDKYGSGAYVYSDGATLEEVTQKATLNANFTGTAMAFTGDDNGTPIDQTGDPALYYKIFDRMSNAYFLEGAFDSYFEQAETEDSFAPAMVSKSIKTKKVSAQLSPNTLVWDSIDGLWEGTYVNTTINETVQLDYDPTNSTTTITVDGSDSATQTDYDFSYVLQENDVDTKMTGTIEGLITDNSTGTPEVSAMRIALTACDPAQYGSGTYTLSVGDDLATLIQELELTATYQQPNMVLTGWLEAEANTFNVTDGIPYTGN